MGDKALTGFIAILTAIIGVAIIAVLVSKNSNTSGVLSAGGSAFSNIIKTAISPVTGGGSSISSGLFGGTNSAGLANIFTQ